MKQLIFAFFLVIFVACHCSKKTVESDKEKTPVLKTKQDSLEYFRKKGIENSLEEKMLPIYKDKADSTHRKK